MMIHKFTKSMVPRGLLFLAAATLPLVSQPALALTGGPDTYGYRFSDEPGKIAFDWVDISGTGTEIISGGDNVGSGPIALGFPLTIYGVTLNSLVASSNGYLSAAPTDNGGDSTNDPIPTNVSPAGARIYAYHGDLDLNANGTVHYQFFPKSPFARYSGAVSVFQWTTAQLPGGSAISIDFQVLIFDSGDIVFQYDTGVPVGNGISVGIQNGNGSDGLQYAYNEIDSPITDNRAILFEPPTIMVSTKEDTDDGALPYSLREAMTLVPVGGKILIADSLSGQTLELSTGVAATTLLPTKAMSIVHLGELPFYISGGKTIDTLLELQLPTAVHGLAFIEATESALLVDHHASITRCHFLGNTSPTNGAGANVTDGNTIFQGCRFAYNSAPSGSGLYVDAVSHLARVEGCDFSHNTASNEGGGMTLRNSTLRLENNTFSHNTASNWGGGAYLSTLSAVVRQNTFVENFSGFRGGAIFISSPGASSYEIAHNTLADNRSVSQGAGIAAQNAGNGSIAYNIFSNNRQVSGTLDHIYRATFVVTSTGYNIADSSEPEFGHVNDLPNTDAKLSPLGAYGGSLLTMMPLRGSPAIDGTSVFIATPAGLPLDQRGQPRNMDSDGVGGVATLDIGALEVGEVIEVTTALDQDDLVNPLVSLREALKYATAKQTQIYFAPALSGATINLSNLNQISVAKALAFIDASDLASPVTLQADSLSPALIGNMAVSGQTIAFQNVIFRDFRSASSQSGGALSDFFNLTVNDCQFYNNWAFNASGGAIDRTDPNLDLQGHLVINNSVFSGNRGQTSSAVDAFSALLRITNSSFDQGVTTGHLRASLCDVRITSSSFTRSPGRGISQLGNTTSAVVGSPGFYLENVTISGNENGALSAVGGRFLSRVVHSTLYANRGGTAAGGVSQPTPSLFSSNHPLYFSHCIVAGNFTTDTGLENFGTGGDYISEGHNLTDSLEQFSPLNEVTDITDEDPWLGPLTRNQGVGLTHHPLMRSPALDAGSSFTSAYRPWWDARGKTRIVNGDLTGSPLIDIGAVEAAAPVVVTTLNDELNTPTGGTRSLREAIRDAVDGGRITIATGLGGGTIDLSTVGSQMLINKSLLIDATGDPQGITLLTPNDDNGHLRITGADTVVALHGLSFRNGASSTSGGALYIEDASVTLTHAAIYDNLAEGDGGGIYQDGGFLLLENATIGENIAEGRGGAIYCESGSTLELRHSTIFANRANNAAAGLHLNASNLTLYSSVIAFNRLLPSGTSNASVGMATFVSQGYNLADDNFLSTSIPHNSTDYDNTAPNLFSTMTVSNGLANGYLPGPGSAILNGGPESNFGPPTWDARGLRRVVGGRMEIGAYESGNLDVDSDNDKMDDAWEIQNFTNHLDPADAALDNDGDGQSNLAEYRAQTDPNDRDSVLRVTDLQHSPTGISMTWNAVPGLRYRVLYALNLANPTLWDEEAVMPAGAFGVSSLQYTVTNLLLDEAQCFFAIEPIVPEAE